MKAIIENVPNRNETSSIQVEAIDRIFMAILENITSANNVDELKLMMSETARCRTCKNYCFDDLFLYGFGGSHMWVKEKIKGEPKRQLIFVEF